MKQFASLVRFAFINLFLSLSILAALAQALPENFAKHEATVANMSKQLEQLSKQIDNTKRDSDLLAIEEKAEDLLEEINTISEQLSPDYKALKIQVDTLGQSDSDTKTEDKKQDEEKAETTDKSNKTVAKLSDENQKLTASFEKATTLMNRLKLLKVQTGQLITKAQERRRNNFTTLLFERHKGPLSSGFWRTMRGEITQIYNDMKLHRERFRSSRINPFPVVISLGIFLLAWVLSFWVMPLFFTYYVKQHTIAYVKSHSALVSLGRLFVHLGAPLVASAAFLWWAQDVLPSFEDTIFAWQFFLCLIIIIGAHQLSRALFIPYRFSNALLVPPKKNGKALHRLFILGGFIYALFWVGHNILEHHANTTVNLWILHGCLTVICLSLVFLALAKRVKGEPVHLKEQAGQQDQAEEEQKEPRKLFGISIWRWMRFIWLVGVFASIISILFGYFALGVYLIIQTVHITFLVGVYALLSRVITDIRDDLSGQDTLLGGQFAQRFRVEEKRQTTLAFWLSFFLQILLVIGALVAFAILSGIDWQDVEGWFNKVLFDMKSGSLDFSLSSLAIALGIFLIGAFFTRNIQSWFSGSFAPHANLQSDVRDSMRTGLGYLGIILSLLVAVSYVGLDFTNLAIVAGALSVGIGFGLQSIVNNFVSGLILLIERPVKVGDWIYVGDHNGRVKNISVRSTEIETFDQSTVIIPNSELIMGRILNWNHGTSRGRLKIPVGVGYGSDVELVKKLLLEVVQEHPACLKYPEPDVLFTDFGASSLDFELRSYIRNIQDVVQVRSELRFKVLEKLRANDIEIPFPQRDVHIVSGGG